MSLTGDPRPRYELLLRMVGEDGDLIPPGAFLDAAERFELIGDIDRWVLRRAADLLAEFEAAGTRPRWRSTSPPVSVGDPELAGVIAAELRPHGCGPRQGWCWR